MPSPPMSTHVRSIASGWQNNKPDAHVHAAWRAVKSAASKERGIYSVLAFVALVKKAVLRKQQSLRFCRHHFEKRHAHPDFVTIPEGSQPVARGKRGTSATPGPRSLTLPPAQGRMP